MKSAVRDFGNASTNRITRTAKAPVLLLNSSAFMGKIIGFLFLISNQQSPIRNQMQLAAE